MVWQDSRTSRLSPTAQRVERNGHWGYPSGIIFSCTDVPGDQGGLVNLAWYASRLDPWPDLQIDSYYALAGHRERSRGAGRGAARRGREPDGDRAAWLARGRATGRAAGHHPRSHGPVYRYEPRGSTVYFWELVDTQDAYHLSSYSKTIPTLFDSTEVTDRYHYFQVMAHGTDPRRVLDLRARQRPLGGQPGARPPQGLAGTLLFEPDGIDLIWFANSETDLSHYAVYRGADPGLRGRMRAASSPTPRTPPASIPAGWATCSTTSSSRWTFTATRARLRCLPPPR